MRKPRMLQEGARYHVTARANRKEMILDSDPMKELFLSVLKRARRKYRFRIENFCIMGNHFHLIIRPANGTNLSSIMQWIMSVFAMAYNRIWKLTGHVWGSRFFSRIISGLRELMQVFKYIDENPLKARKRINSRAWRYNGLGHDSQRCREILDAIPPWLGMLFPNHTSLALF
jgi:putative transposase